MYTVYKHLNENEEIIYVGKSKSLLYRQRQHKDKSDWFDEIDSIEYCTLNSKTEMDLVEVYLINTLNPKYNKKDKREDDLSNINLGEIEWLEFDMNELVVQNNKKENKIGEFFYNHEDFVEKCLKTKTKKYYTLLDGSTEEFYKVEGINFEHKLVHNGYVKDAKNFKDIVIYEFYTIFKDELFNPTLVLTCMLTSDNVEILSKFSNRKGIFNANNDIFKVDMTVPNYYPSLKEEYHRTLDWL